MLEQEIITAYYYQRGKIACMLREDTQVKRAVEEIGKLIIEN